MLSRKSSRRSDQSGSSRKSSRKDSISELRRKNASSEHISSSKKALRGDDRKASRRDSRKHGEGDPGRNAGSGTIPERSSSHRHSEGIRKQKGYANEGRQEHGRADSGKGSRRPSSKYIEGAVAPIDASSSKTYADRDAFDGDTYRSSRAEEGLYGSESADPELSSHIPNQFPDQTPLNYSIPYLPNRTDSYGAAADYYGDTGESVHHQPGVRAHTPLLQGHEVHLMPASAEPAPPEETGHGAAAEFYSSAEAGTVTSLIPTPPPLVHAHTISAGPPPQVSNTQQPFPGQSPASHSHLPAYVAGAAVISATALAHHQNHHSEATSLEPHINVSPASARPNHHFYTPQSQIQQSNRNRRGPLDKFVDWWNDYEDVRKMEEYSEYTGVCRHCFDPQSSPAEAPRAHKPRKTQSRESLNHGRVDKERRYHLSESEGRRRRNDALASAAVGTALASHGLPQAGRRVDQSDSEPEARRLRRSRSVQTSTHRHGAHSPRSSQGPSSRSQMIHQNGSQWTSQPSHAVGFNTSWNPSGTRPAGLVESARRKHSIRPENFPPRSQRTRMGSSTAYQRPSSSSSEEAKTGFFGGFFSTPKKSKARRSARKDRIYSHPNDSSSSSNLDLAYGAVRDFPRKKSRKDPKDSEDPGTAAQNALLGIGAAAAALAAHTSRRDRVNIHGSGIKALGRKRSASRGDAEWESASSEDEDDGDVSSASSGLAFGGSGIGRKPTAHISSDSLSSASSGTGKWGWRWGSKKPKRPKNVRDKPVQHIGPMPMVQEPIHMVDDDSPNNERQSVRPHPSTTASAPRIFESTTSPRTQAPSTLPNPLDSPTPGAPVIQPVQSNVPIQHPKPTVPLKSHTFPISSSERAPIISEQTQTTKRSKHDEEVKEAPALDSVKFVDDMSGRWKEQPQRRAMNPDMQRVSSGTSNDPGFDQLSRDKSFAYAGAAAGVAAGAFALRGRRSSSSDSSGNTRLRRRSSKQKNRRRQSQSDMGAEHNHDQVREAEPPPNWQKSPFSITSPSYPPAEGVIAKPLEMPEFGIANDIWESGQDIQNQTEQRDIFNNADQGPNAPKSPMKGNALQDWQPELNDLSQSMQDKYKRGPESQADFFAPKGIRPGSSSSKNATRFDPPHYDAPGSPIDPRFFALRGAPRLNVIAPTPPESEAGFARSTRSHSPSPIRHSTVNDEAGVEHGHAPPEGPHEDEQRIEAAPDSEFGDTHRLRDFDSAEPESIVHGADSANQNEDVILDEHDDPESFGFAPPRQFVLDQQDISEALSDIVDPAPSAGGFVLGEVEDDEDQSDGKAEAEKIVEQSADSFESQDQFTNYSKGIDAPASDKGESKHHRSPFENEEVENDLLNRKVSENRPAERSPQDSEVEEPESLSRDSKESSRSQRFATEPLLAASAGLAGAYIVSERLQTLGADEEDKNAENESLRDEAQERHIPGAFFSGDDVPKEREDKHADLVAHSSPRETESREPLFQKGHEQRAISQPLSFDSISQSREAIPEQAFDDALNRAKSPKSESATANELAAPKIEHEDVLPDDDQPPSKDLVLGAIANGQRDTSDANNTTPGTELRDQWDTKPSRKSRKARGTRAQSPTVWGEEGDYRGEETSAGYHPVNYQANKDAHYKPTPEPDNEPELKRGKKSKKAKRQKYSQFDPDLDATDKKVTFDSLTETPQISEAGNGYDNSGDAFAETPPSSKERRKMKKRRPDVETTEKQVTFDLLPQLPQTSEAGQGAGVLGESFTEMPLSSTERKKLAKRQMKQTRNSLNEESATDKGSRERDPAPQEVPSTTNYEHANRDPGTSSQDLEDKVNQTLPAKSTITAMTPKLTVDLED